MNMKKIYLIICLSLLYSPFKTLAQSSNDKNQILQQCVSLEQLNEKIPKKTTNYYVLNHGIDFSNSLNLEVKGKKISILEKSDLNISRSYFLFHTLNIDGNTAFVRYYYKYTIDNLEKVIPITLSFQKKESKWEIVNCSI